VNYRDRRRQRGMTIPMVALMIVGLLTMAALAIDLGVLYTARTSAQHAADAAALAGAFTFLNPAASEPTDATNAAIAVAAQNHILGQTVTLAAGDIVVDLTNRRVTVTVSRTGANGIGTYFARIVGKNTVDVVTKATAEASKTAGATHCLKPIFIPNTILSTLTPDTTQSPNACSAGQLLFDSSGAVTSFARSMMGTQENIRPSNPQNSLGPSQFYSLDFGSGANTYRCTLGQCMNDCMISGAVTCGSSYPLETGNMVGPTVQGVNDLTGSPPDQWVALGEYRHADGNIYDTSRSLVVAPVWDDCTQNISPGYHGQMVKVIGFIEMFVDGTSGSNVQAHMVAPIACPKPGSGSTTTANGDNTGPYSIPVRLIQTP
jgi:Flp pilus assembly protein TadG